MYFAYGEEETDYLKKKDKRMAEVIDRIGHVERKVDTDLFSAVVHHIVGQQISTKAQETIWQRMLSALGEVNAETVLAAGVSKLQSLGMTFRKAEYITDFAEKVHTGAFDLEGIWQKSDEEAIRELLSLKGIGVWTAEMILLFCMQRQDVLSYDDLAIQRGLRMVYHHRKIDRGLFEKYRRRFSPYGSVASLYLWAVSGGAIPELHDYAPKRRNKARTMTYTQHYDSPLGGILLAADEEGLTGLWFDGQKYFARTLPKEYAESETPVLCEAKRWLDIYFSGREPDFTPPLHPVGSAFQQAVWALLLEIPYGETTTYGTLARKLAEKQGLTHMSAQAVGGAVGHNDISLIIPCHRVVGASGSLTGYADGVDKKIKLLELERADMKSFFVPKKGTAL